MGVAKKLIDGMSKKDADHIEKFISKVLDMSIKHWESETNKRFKAAAPKGFDSDEEPSEEAQAYYEVFRNWHALMQTKNGFKDWLDPLRPLPRAEHEVCKAHGT